MSKFLKGLRIPIHSDLNAKDTENQTYGCRHSNPDICKYCYVDDICAFVTKDSICRRPSRKWKTIYYVLKGKEEE